MILCVWPLVEAYTDEDILDCDCIGGVIGAWMWRSWTHDRRGDHSVGALLRFSQEHKRRPAAIQIARFLLDV